MPSVKANNLSLEYQEFGRSGSPVILLIVGLYGQLIDWPSSFCALLAAGGYRVIRFDNRDIGGSERLDQLEPPSMAAYALSATWGQRPPSVYNLDDMAKDAIGLLDALEIDRAHIIGFSMGGVIGQIMASDYGTRVETLTCISSTTGNPWLPPPHWRVLQLISSPSYLFGASGHEQKMELEKLLMSPACPRSEDEHNLWIETRTKRSPDCDGLARQLAASLNTGDVSARLSKVNCPTMVIHGDSDKLVSQASGLDIVKKVEGAEFRLIEGMGHELPEAFSAILSELILDHLRAAGCGQDCDPEAA